MTHHQVLAGFQTATESVVWIRELIEVLEGMQIGAADPARQRLHQHFARTRFRCSDLAGNHLLVPHYGCAHDSSFCVPVQSEKLSYSCSEGKRLFRIEINFLHRDDHIAVINKPTDVSLLKDRSGADCLWDLLPDLLGQKPYLVHRLDKPTSGALAIALSQRAQKQLTRAFAARRVRKFYLAWVLGDPGPDGVIDLPLKKGRKSRYRVAGPRAGIQAQDRRWSLAEADDDGHPSLTRFRRLQQAGGRSLLLLMPKTGRTHQLRVHLAWIGHPILGDRLYGRPGDAAQLAERLYLHASRLCLPDQYGSFRAPVDSSWRDLSC